MDSPIAGAVEGKKKKILQKSLGFYQEEASLAFKITQDFVTAESQQAFKRGACVFYRNGKSRNWVVCVGYIFSLSVRLLSLGFAETHLKVTT